MIGWRGAEAHGAASAPSTLWVALTIVLTLSFTVPSGAVSTTPVPIRDAAAISTLQSSIAAMGGSSVAATIQDWTVTGTLAGTVSTQAAKTFTWTGAGTEFRVEVDSGSTTNVFVSGYGTPGRISNGTSSAINYHVARAALPFYLPAFLLQQHLNNTVLTLKYVGATTVNGLAAVQVHVSDDSDAVGSLVTPQEWYFDPVSFLPIHVDFRLPTNENANDYSPASFDFANTQLINGMLVPYQISYSKDGALFETFTVSSVVFNSGVPPVTFDPPQGVSQ
jgi:hypothetical protein